jgi:Aldehyde dehydrogenase family
MRVNCARIGQFIDVIETVALRPAGAEAREYGMVGINTGAISSEPAPFGGVTESGIGREARAAFLTRQMLPFFRRYGYDDEVGLENERSRDRCLTESAKRAKRTPVKPLKTKDSAKWLIRLNQ